jgi:hypothetical protein
MLVVLPQEFKSESVEGAHPNLVSVLYPKRLKPVD